MNKKKVNSIPDKLTKLFESYNQNNIEMEIKRLVDPLNQGKKFLSNESIHRLKDFASPIFDIEVINQPGPVSQYQEFISTVVNAQPDFFQEEKEYFKNKIFNTMDHPMNFVKYLFPIYSDQLTYIRCVQKSRKLLDIFMAYKIIWHNCNES